MDGNIIGFLKQSSITDEQINEVVDKIISELNEDKFKEMINNLQENDEVNYSHYSKFILKLANSLSSVQNLPLQFACLHSIVNLIEIRKLDEKQKFEILRIYADSLKANDLYGDAARILEQFPEPTDSESSQLRYYLEIMECYYKDDNTDKASSFLTKTSSHVFVQTTPTDLLNRYDELRGYLSIAKKSFLEAAYSFDRLYKKGRTPELKSLGMRNAVICAILADSSERKIRLLYRYAADENVKSIDVYPILDYFVTDKFIDKSIRDDFREKSKNLVDVKDTRILETSSTQHNINVARKLFVAIKIDRLAQIVGDTQENVTNILEAMIKKNTLKAKIDQPTLSVEFQQSNQNEAKDLSIQQYCKSVNGIASKIAPLLQ